jgi:ankyrin repeat protein
VSKSTISQKIFIVMTLIFQFGSNLHAMNATHPLNVHMNDFPEPSERQKFRDVCMKGKINLVIEMLQEISDPYAIIVQSDSYDYTALHYAAMSGSVEIVNLLLDIAKKKINLHKFITKRNRHGQTALDVARLRNGHPKNTEAIMTLLESYEVQ